MRSLPGKTRTRGHVLADLSINQVERQVLLCGFSVDRVQHDYGYDLTMATNSARGEFEPGAVYIQVKATDWGMATIRDKMGHCPHEIFTMTPPNGSPSHSECVGGDDLAPPSGREGLDDAGS